MTTALPAHLDLSNVQALDADDLAQRLTDAQAAHRDARAQGMRETARDLHTAVRVFEAETRRRAEADVVAEAEAIVDSAVCDEACADATSHHTVCRCRCGGVNHGANLAGRREAVAFALGARYVRPGFTAQMLAATADEDAF